MTSHFHTTREFLAVPYLKGFGSVPSATQRSMVARDTAKILHKSFFEYIIRVITAIPGKRAITREATVDAAHDCAAAGEYQGMLTCTSPVGLGLRHRVR